MITTKTIIPPPIAQYFNRYLLDPLIGRLRHVEDVLIPLAKKKLRNCPGKQREFTQLLEQYYRTYERKKTEEADYKAKIDKAQKRPNIPITGGTMQFRRFQS